MESQVIGVDFGKKSIEVVRINSENSLERRQFSTTKNGINNLLCDLICGNSTVFSL
ncbi:Mobile element protein [Leptospira interrogans serovar Hardjo str. Norma]|uniref:Mobile element protein n=1 Tax=Leptospira interrogans serovar Hardjo str. Norma TaxID=1279460 RepID=A0A0M4NV88_LEPIR|nr:Mobile element protein [Leptospira interrogans serovar Hardjo str. Norma]EKO95383.1 hypothetical protein LEP1GSC057_1141 [Leptospira interrogans str. Brem 329]